MTMFVILKFSFCVWRNVKLGKRLSTRTLALRHHNDIQHNGTQNNIKVIATLSITTLSIMALNTVMLNAYAECHISWVGLGPSRPIMLSVIMLSVIMLSVIMLSVVMLSVVAPEHSQSICYFDFLRFLETRFWMFSLILWPIFVLKLLKISPNSKNIFQWKMVVIIQDHTVRMIHIEWASAFTRSIYMGLTFSDDYMLKIYPNSKNIFQWKMVVIIQDHTVRMIHIEWSNMHWQCIACTRSI